MSIDNDPVVPADASAVNTEVSTPQGRAAPVERPGSRRSNRKPYEVRSFHFPYLVALITLSSVQLLLRSIKFALSIIIKFLVWTRSPVLSIRPRQSLIRWRHELRWNSITLLAEMPLFLTPPMLWLVSLTITSLSF